MSEESAAGITRASKSNLALAFVAMSGKRRRDITTFYAFCRLIDDIADEPNRTPASQREELNRWREALLGPIAGESVLAPPIRELIRSYPGITPAMLGEIITGVEMDVDGSRYQRWEDLQVYCYRVASAVGLVSIEIFGYRNARCREYAVALGLALQMTNIIRDVGVDLAAERIYLPLEDFARAGYTEEELRLQMANERFRTLIGLEVARAEEYFAEARRLLPREDRRSMLPAEIMRSIYHALLEEMRRDGFQVFTKRYRLSKWGKTTRVLQQMLKFA